MTSSSSFSPAFYQPGLLCGFVPKEPVVAALGTSDVTTRGAVSAGGDPMGNCVVYRKGSDYPAVEITLGAAVGGVSGTDVNSIRRDLEHPGADWYRYPDSAGLGWAHAAYSQTVAGRHVTGALSALARGDYAILARLYGPEPGRNAVTDVTGIVTGIVAALQLPAQPSTPYPAVPSRSAS